MKLKVILASVSLAFGFFLLIQTSVLIQTHIYIVVVDTEVERIFPFPPRFRVVVKGLTKYTRCNPNESPNDVSKKKECKNMNDNYDGVLATFALALIASLFHIAAFIWAAIKSEDWMPWTIIHIGVLVFTLISFALGVVYKVQQNQLDYYRIILTPSRDGTRVWVNQFAVRQGLYWGMVFLAITALDSIFCIAAVVVGFMK